MNGFILHNGTLTPTEDTTPSARKQRRDHGDGFVVLARPDTAHRNLAKYLED